MIEVVDGSPDARESPSIDNCAVNGPPARAQPNKARVACSVLHVLSTECRAPRPTAGGQLTVPCGHIREP